jgi:hypothetical protein
MTNCILSNARPAASLASHLFRQRALLFLISHRQRLPQRRSAFRSGLQFLVQVPDLAIKVELDRVPSRLVVSAGVVFFVLRDHAVRLVRGRRGVPDLAGSARRYICPDNVK